MGSAIKTIRYEYDEDGNRSALIDHDGGRFTYTYDAVNRITQVQNPQGDRTSYSYDGANRRTLKKMANGTRASFSYDPAGNLTKLYNLKSDGTVLSSFEYAYDKVGNRTSVAEADGSRVTWSYDNTYQLTGEHRTGTSAYRDTYTYDPSGNRLLKIHDGARTTYAYDAANQIRYTEDISGRTTYTFDADGNQQVVRAPSGDRTTYVWDYENRMTSVQQPSGIRNTMAYDADGLRMKLEESGGTKKFVWDDQNYLAETDAANDTQVVYTNEPRRYGNLISQRRGSTSHWYHFDAIGSTRELTNSSAVITDTRLYDAWGNEVGSTGTTVFPFGYVGGIGYYAIPFLSLFYVRARFLQPSQGRWISTDPLFNAIERLLGQFTYSDNAPLCKTDPSGLAAGLSDPLPWCECVLGELYEFAPGTLIDCAANAGCLTKIRCFRCPDPKSLGLYIPPGTIGFCANNLRNIWDRPSGGLSDNREEVYAIIAEELYHALSLCDSDEPWANTPWSDLQNEIARRSVPEEYHDCIIAAAEEILAKYCAGVAKTFDRLRNEASKSGNVQSPCDKVGWNLLPYDNPIENTLRAWFGKVDEYCSSIDSACRNVPFGSGLDTRASAH